MKNTEPALLSKAKAPRAHSPRRQASAASPARRQPKLYPSTAKAAALVLGMHRSGTSSVAGALVRLGAKAPNALMQPDSGNAKGYFESIALMRLNDEILASAGSVWHDWRAFSEDWAASAAAREFEAKGVATLSQEFGDASLIVVKDPRISRMTPFWMRIFDRAGYVVRVFMPVRSPLEVARSLRARYGFPISKGLLLWLRHVLDAEISSRNLPRAVFHWGDFLTDWRLTMDRAAEQTGLIWPRLSDWSAAEIDAFISSELQHEIVEPAAMLAHPDVSEWVRAVYRAMIALAKDPTSDSARQTLDDVRSDFGRASKIFGRALVEFEENMTLALGQAGEARIEVGNIRQDAANERLRADALSAQLDVLLAERAALAEQLASLRAERDRLTPQAAE